jgi:aldehyde dehydrogenase (NAD+)
VSVVDELYEPVCLIGGSPVRTANSFPVTYPYSGEVVGAAPILSRDDVRRALDLGAAAEVRLDRYERSQVLERIATVIAAQAEELARMITVESGLCLKDTRYEVERAENVFRLAAVEVLRDDGRVFAGDIARGGKARRAFTHREPVSLVAAITPFNHPLNQVAHKLAPAIAAGTSMVLKPSEKTPLAGLWLGRVAVEAGYPPDALAVLTGDRAEILDAFLAHERVEVIAFTGGVRVGKEIASRLGYRRAVLELGGNDPLLVLADADIEEAAQLAVRGATANSGQRCTAVKRVIADESLADRLVDRVAELAVQVRVGDPLSDETDVGTLIDEEAAATVERRVVAAIADGATLLHGGERESAQIVPPVLDRVPVSTELVHEETFGPAIPVIHVSGLSEAIETANGTAYGLSAGIVSNDLSAITRCVRELKVGTVNVREVPGYRTELTPFGGVKSSGLGAKEGIAEAIAAYSNVRLFTLPWPAS